MKMLNSTAMLTTSINLDLPFMDTFLLEVFGEYRNGIGVDNRGAQQVRVSKRSDNRRLLRKTKQGITSIMSR
jgi:hypothetical protein